MLLRRPLLRLLSWLTRHLPAGILSPRTTALVLHDTLRARVRSRQGQGLSPVSARLHLGCGGRRVPGWLNVDLERSEQDVDVACGRLPWKDAAFTDVVSEHLIEHLELRTELIPLLGELCRVIAPGGELWLSTPDLDKLCRGYVQDGAIGLLADRRSRWAAFDLGPGVPATHLINHLFHQEGEHRNLFDLSLLRWALVEAGWPEPEPTTEERLLERYPGFPARRDEAQTLYVRVLRR